MSDVSDDFDEDEAVQLGVSIILNTSRNLRPNVM